MRRKLVLAVILILSLIVSVFGLIACGESGENNTPAQTNTDPQTPDSGSSGGGNNAGSGQGDQGGEQEPPKAYEAELLALEGFNDEGDKYYTLTVPNAVSTYAFSNLITVSEEATYTVRHEDEPNPSADGTINLREARNRIFIDVYSKDGGKHNYFTVDIYRNRLYKIYYSLSYKTLDYFGEVHWDNVDLGDNAYLTVEEGNRVPVPEFEKRLGFDFDYGDYDFETPATPGHVNTYMAITGTPKEEMQDFEFTSTTDTCEIKSIWIKNEQAFTELTIPEYITKIDMDYNKISGFSNSAQYIEKVYWNAKRCEFSDDNDYGLFSHGGWYPCEVIIGDTCEYLPAGAFNLNDKINKTTIGSGLKEVGGWGAFGGSCKNFYIKDLKQFIEIKDLDKANITVENLYLNDNLITELTIPDGITEVPAKIFKNGSYRKIVIPEGVTKIGDEAFWGCYVQELSLPDTLTEIGERAFCGANITELVIPDSVLSIDDYAFSYCSSLTRVVLGTGLENGTVGENAFGGCNIYEVYDKCYFAFDVDNNLCGKVAVNAYRIIRPNDYNQDSSVHKVQGEDGNT